MSVACCRDDCHQKSLEYLVKHGRRWSTARTASRLSRSPSWIIRSMDDIYTADRTATTWSAQGAGRPRVRL